MTGRDKSRHLRRGEKMEEDGEYRNKETTYAYMNKELDKTKNRIRELEAKLHDPVFLSAMLAQVVHEKENTNRILKNIYSELEQLRSQTGKGKEEARRPALSLSETDQQIILLAKKNGKICAEDVQKKLDYKGKNGASARLNRLYMIGLLKKQPGRVVYYFTE